MFVSKTRIYVCDNPDCKLNGHKTEFPSSGEFIFGHSLNVYCNLCECNLSRLPMEDRIQTSE